MNEAEIEQRKNAARAKKTPAKHLLLRKKFAEMIKDYAEQDLRFFYFRDYAIDLGIANNRQAITAVSLVDRNTNTVRIAFSFCSLKDHFSKIEGKVNALDHLLNENHPYRLHRLWSGDSLTDVAQAFNSLKNKPSKFKKWKFNIFVELVNK